jgi:HEAT repeat protein
MNRQELEALLDRVARGDEAADDALLAYIAEQSPGIQTLAIEALRDGGADMREQLILTLADDPALNIRSTPRATPAPEASDLEGAYPGGQSRPAPPPPADEGRAPGELLVRLKSSDPNERIEAVHAAAGYEDARMVPALMDALASDNRHLAGAAEQALRRQGGMAVPALTEMLQSGDQQARWHAARVLSHTADQRAIPALIGALEDGNYGTRWLAAEALVRLGKPVLSPLFQRLAEEEKVGAWLKQGVFHVLNKIKLQKDEAHYREVAREVRNASAGVIPTVARRELDRLG